MTNENETFAKVIKRNNLLAGNACDELIVMCKDCPARKLKVSMTQPPMSCAATTKIYLERMEDEVEKLEMLVSIHN
jgi:hypothetical protein